DASAASLVPFVQDSVEPGTVIHTDGWLGYLPLESKGYEHEVTFLKGKKKTPSELMPRVHLVISLLKRWLMGTHQGAVSHKHLDYYLDEFTFRFNRRRSKSRGKLFLRLTASMSGGQWERMLTAVVRNGSPCPRWRTSLVHSWRWLGGDGIAVDADHRVAAGR